MAHDQHERDHRHGVRHDHAQASAPDGGVAAVDPDVGIGATTAPAGPGGAHGHHHHHHGAASLRAGARHQGRLLGAFALQLTFMVVEVVAAFWTGSLALLSDAAHMVTDVLGLGMALAAVHLASRGSTARHRTFGWYRLEILAALANAVLLFGVTGYVLVEALRRVGDAPDVLAGPMLVVAVLGLCANLAAFALLRGGATESLNVEGAYLEMVADTIGSVGVIVAAVVIRATGWTWVDPVVALTLGLFVLPRTWGLAGQALRILVQAAPPGTDLDAVEADLRSVEGVIDVHDLHVWTLTSEMDVATAHLMIGRDADAHGVLDRARQVLDEVHGITHATLQVEPEDHQGCDQVTW